nr:retrovirus-related Pol polyprotein from transposon 17.6 [Tanacetum cinerariifolium]
MRLDVPKFTGVDPDSWLFSVNEYFSLLNTLVDRRLRIVGFNLEGAAAERFRLMTRNGLITDWDRFEESVKNRFGPSKYEDPHGALSKLIQTSTVAEYQNAFSLARVTKARLDDQSMASVIPKAVATVNSNGKPLAIKWISPAESQERLSKGLCFNCDKKWIRGHKCPSKFLLLMTDTEDDTSKEFAASEDEAMEVVPTCLTPHRLVDHGIHLLPNTKPVNMRPYHYPHYQKGKMEKLVNDMLSQGIIRFSHRRFSSPILLVKKKDGSYRFCVDYRALNAATVNDKFLIPMVDEMFDELGRAESVESGPLLWPSIEENRVTRLKKYSELSTTEAIQADCDVKATNIILQGLPLEQERECKLYDEFDKLAYRKGESLRDYYLIFLLLLNDMNIYNMKLKQFQVNTKFLNTLPPEWSKFVTDVKLVRDLHTTNVDQLHAYLGFVWREVIEVVGSDESGGKTRKEGLQGFGEKNYSVQYFETWEGQGR